MAQVNLANRTYFLCIDDDFAKKVISEWIYLYKETPLNLRKARKGVKDSFVLVIKDRDGADLLFIERIARITNALIEVR